MQPILGVRPDHHASRLSFEPLTNTGLLRQWDQVIARAVRSAYSWQVVFVRADLPLGRIVPASLKVLVWEGSGLEDT